MAVKKMSPRSRLSKADNAPELTGKWFAQAELRDGKKLVRLADKKERALWQSSAKA